ncbi:hypothetical protein [uncultured Microbulbifer sp.]|uniref:hypothetical protein n=1 Tax=uncultured Microbulbifer sp. TaxID=348147 RepID=UPI0025EE9CEB|nr:hypothetical protein [uncultured Microbulbifer sp.]
MSGRKKNRKHNRGQPPHQLLDELSSLRDLLGSETEADIPLLDQVADPNSANIPDRRPPQKPVSAQRPLEEADLPILFSPIDEEPVDDFTPQLSEADRELLRPLQNLPRKSLQPEMADESELSLATKPEQESATREPREEFQPGLFDAPVKAETRQEPAPEAVATAKPASKATPAPTLAAGENPFLPPHIRARLTGGRIPKPEPEKKATPAPQERHEALREENRDGNPQVTPEPELPQATASALAEDPTGDERPKPSQRERLIEQLVAEQLPELERQLRANIIAVVDEIYPEQ